MPENMLRFPLKVHFCKFIILFLLAGHTGAFFQQAQAMPIEDLLKEQQHADEIDQIPGEAQTDDPLEGFNRVMFAIHEVLDGLFLQPCAEIYDLVVHPYLQDRVHNVMQNLGTPGTFINDCLQGEGERAAKSISRFILNSTLGIAGLHDFAADVAEITPHQEDFGQTMAVYGVDSGPYLVIPVLGPSTMRDFIGTLVELLADPVNYALRRYSTRSMVYARTGLDALDQRSKLLPVTNRLSRTLDPYTSYKTLYLQNREYNINNGEMVRDTPTPDED